MPKPRILVLSASVGAGHVRAAEAVALALKQLDPAAAVTNLDVLSFAGRMFRKVYGEAYLDLVNKAPHVLGYFYDLMDRPHRGGRRSGASDRLRLLVQNLNLPKFLRYLREHPADVVVNTHFLPAELIANLKRKGKFAAPQFTATTDFETHRLWVHQPCERYFTATEEGAAYLAHWGVPAETITATGIPIHPVFAEPKSREACLKKHGLPADRPVLLQLAGGFGVGPIAKIHQGLLALETPLALVAVAGKNAMAKDELEKLPVPPRHFAKVLGFTTEIDELMAAADLVVSKPGGLTTSETLARGAAMAVVNPIPGQESRNSDYLLENGAAVKINNLATLSCKLTPLLKDPARLAALKSNAKKLGRPQAAFEVAKAALATAGQASSSP